jgi:hypothetical protein
MTDANTTDANTTGTRTTGGTPAAEGTPVEPAEAQRATRYVPAWQRFRHRMAHEVLPKEMLSQEAAPGGSAKGASK